MYFVPIHTGRMFFRAAVLGVFGLACLFANPHFRPQVILGWILLPLAAAHAWIGLRWWWRGFRITYFPGRRG
jgi:hypothetical protein